MNLVGSVQSFVLLLLGIGSAGLTGYAFADVLRRKGTAVPARRPVEQGRVAGHPRRCLPIAIVSFGSPGTLGLLNVVGVVAAGVYLADLKPKLKQVGGGSGSSYGPYGPY